MRIPHLTSTKFTVQTTNLFLVEYQKNFFQYYLKDNFFLVSAYLDMIAYYISYSYEISTTNQHSMFIRYNRKARNTYNSKFEDFSL